MTVGGTIGPYLNYAIIFGFVLAGTIFAMQYILPIIKKMKKSKR